MARRSSKSHAGEANNLETKIDGTSPVARILVSDFQRRSWKSPTAQVSVSVSNRIRQALETPHHMRNTVRAKETGVPHEGESQAGQWPGDQRPRVGPTTRGTREGSITVARTDVKLERADHDVQNRGERRAPRESLSPVDPAGIAVWLSRS
ncbi:hypothetical protein LY76DRAFT_609222 [Colletotrichum caudatum]|nr:hypothetical protein LY76DRAFT_609222 [Colletotrichum caudatum]